MAGYVLRRSVLSLSLLAAVDSGMDQVAHLPLRGDPQSDSVKRVIAHLRAKGTVIDPTASWGEIGGKSAQEPMQNIQPVMQHLPASLAQNRVDKTSCESLSRWLLDVIKAMLTDPFPTDRTQFNWPPLPSDGTLVAKQSRPH